MSEQDQTLIEGDITTPAGGRIADLEAENARLQLRATAFEQWFKAAVKHHNDLTTERDGYMALAERREEALPAIVFALRYDDFGDEDWITWERCARRWEETWKPALQEEHFGDCTKQPQACFRCQAEDVVRLATLIRAAIAATPEGEKE